MEEKKPTEGFLFTIVVAEGEPLENGSYPAEKCKQFDDIYESKHERNKALEANLDLLVKEGKVFKKNMWFGKSTGVTSVSKRNKLWEKSKNKNVDFLMSQLESL